MDEEAM